MFYIYYCYRKKFLYMKEILIPKLKKIIILNWKIKFFYLIKSILKNVFKKHLKADIKNDMSYKKIFE